VLRIEETLQYQHGSHLVDDLAMAGKGPAGSVKVAVGFGRGQALVPEMDGQGKGVTQGVCEGLGPGGLGADVARQIKRMAEDNAGAGVFAEEAAQRFQVGLWVFADQGQDRLGGQAELVGDGDTDAATSEIEAQQARRHRGMVARQNVRQYSGSLDRPPHFHWNHTMTQESLPPRNSGRIPSLDGIRAVAIFLVILLHISERFALGIPQTTKGILQYFVLGCGVDGVGIFFVLSGFLITTLLLKESRTQGTISLLDFYVRRAFRILPPLYFYLAFAILFCLLIEHAVQWPPLVAAAFFYRDYASAHQELLSQAWMTQHTWSLSVEEQFYILWPPVLALVLKRRGQMPAAKLAAILIVITPLLRVATKFSHVSLFDHRLMYLLHTRMDALMCGCLLALLVGEPLFEKLFAMLSKIWWILPLEIFLVSPALKVLLGVYWMFTIGLTVDGVFVALFLLWVARNEHSFIGVFLNSRIMVGAGILSYSAYLWQTFFLHGDNPTRSNQMPWCLMWIWIAAGLSYLVVERPALWMRHRIQRRTALRIPAEIELGQQDSAVQIAD